MLPVGGVTRIRRPAPAIVGAVLVVTPLLHDLSGLDVPNSNSVIRSGGDEPFFLRRNIERKDTPVLVGRAVRTESLVGSEELDRVRTPKPHGHVVGCGQDAFAVGQKLRGNHFARHAPVPERIAATRSRATRSCPLSRPAFESGENTTDWTSALCPSYFARRLPSRSQRRAVRSCSGRDMASIRGKYCARDCIRVTDQSGLLASVLVPQDCGLIVRR